MDQINVAGASIDIEGDRKWDFILTVMVIIENDTFGKMMVTQAASVSSQSF